MHKQFRSVTLLQGRSKVNNYACPTLALVFLELWEL